MRPASMCALLVALCLLCDVRGFGDGAGAGAGETWVLLGNLKFPLSFADVVVCETSNTLVVWGNVPIDRAPAGVFVVGATDLSEQKPVTSRGDVGAPTWALGKKLVKLGESGGICVVAVSDPGAGKLWVALVARPPPFGSSSSAVDIHWVILDVSVPALATWSKSTSLVVVEELTRAQGSAAQAIVAANCKLPDRADALRASVAYVGPLLNGIEVGVLVANCKPGFIAWPEASPAPILLNDTAGVLPRFGPVLSTHSGADGSVAVTVAGGTSSSLELSIRPPPELPLRGAEIVPGAVQLVRFPNATWRRRPFSGTSRSWQATALGCGGALNQGWLQFGGLLAQDDGTFVRRDVTGVGSINSSLSSSSVVLYEDLATGPGRLVGPACAISRSGLVLVGGLSLSLSAQPEEVGQVWLLALGPDGGAEFVQGADPTPDTDTPPVSEPPASAPSAVPAASPAPSPGFFPDVPRSLPPTRPLNAGSAVGVGVGVVACAALLFAAAQFASRRQQRQPPTATLAGQA
jgi:hypothetical protein